MFMYVMYLRRIYISYLETEKTNLIKEQGEYLHFRLREQTGVVR